MEERFGEIFGIKIAAGSREELFLAAIPYLWRGGAIATVNPEMLSDSLENVKLRAYLNSALCIPDGVGVRKALAEQGVKTEVLPGVELGEMLLDTVPVRLGVIGGSGGVAEAAMKNLLSRHHLARRAFALSGYGIRYSEYERAIELSGADVVFVCLGSPKQELFIADAIKRFPSVLFIGLGGSLDIYSGKKRRAPTFMRRLGLEWLYRIVREPRRLKRVPKIMKFFKKMRKINKKTHVFGKKRATAALKTEKIYKN